MLARCPKCERQQLPGTTHCPACGTPSAVASIRPGRPKEGSPLRDPVLDHFVKDELVAFCPDCLNEYREGSLCRHCDLELLREGRKLYDARLQSRPLAELGRRVAAPPAAVPRDLVRVRIARSLGDALRCRQELSFLGLAVTMGSDSLDPFNDAGAVGVYVREHDRAAALYLLDGMQEEDPLDRPPSEEAPKELRHLDAARSWLAFGKYREAERLVRDELDDDPDGALVLFEALLLSGRKRSAEEEARRRSERPGLSPRERHRLLLRVALASALGFEGHPFGEGSDPRASRQILEGLIEEGTRLLDAGKVLVELYEAEGEAARLPALLRAMDRLNPNLLAQDGPFRALRALHG